MNDLNRFKAQEGRLIVESLSRGDKAYIERAAQLNPSAIRLQTFDLSIAPTNPIPMGFAFKTAYVVAATDSAARISLRPFSDSENNDYVPLSVKDVLSFDQPINKCFLTWPVQAGKTITIAFLTDAQFKSGSQVSGVSSALNGTSINDFANPATFTLATAVLLNSTPRNTITIYNAGPDECRIGGAGVLATPGSERGLRLPVGSERKYSNSAAIFVAVNGSCNLEFQTES